MEFPRYLPIYEELTAKKWTWRTFPYWDSIFHTYPKTAQGARGWALSRACEFNVNAPTLETICWMHLFPEVFARDGTYGWRVLTRLEQACTEISSKPAER